MRAECEDPVAMREPGHQEEGRVDTETGRNPRRRRRLRPLRDASDQHTRATCHVRHLFARSWQTERPNMEWLAFNLVPAVWPARFVDDHMK